MLGTLLRSPAAEVNITVRTWASASAVLVLPPGSLSAEMAAWTEATEECALKLKPDPTVDANVTRPTRVLPLSISNLLTSCERNDFVRLKSGKPMLPDSSSTKMMSTGQSIGGGGAATSCHVTLYILTLSDHSQERCVHNVAQITDATCE